MTDTEMILEQLKGMQESINESVQMFVKGIDP